MEQVCLTAGDPAPNFIQRSAANPRFVFDSAAGRYLVLCFYGGASDAHACAALDAVHARPDLFNDDHSCFFGVSNTPEDETSGRVKNRIPGFRHFWDFDFTASRAYGLVSVEDTGQNRQIKVGRRWFVIDPSMRIIAAIPLTDDRSDINKVIDLVENLPPPNCHAGVELMAPILFLPRVFEPELCRHLIGLYEAQGGEESGFMRQIDGKTVGVTDPSFKKRKDVLIEDERLIAALRTRFVRRVVPEIAKVHQFTATRMERYIISCYSAEDGGHFSAHRDNTTKGTAHRRFAVSVNLNDDFGGGEVSFPEYGPRGFKAPPGGAVVFSCSLLHRVSKVTRGNRYAFLPFLYDDASAEIRQKNLGYLATTSASTIA